jgi:transcriptional regulator with XRE-family HTH domain
MDIDRVRRETREDLDRLPDPPAHARLGAVEDALRELGTAYLPSEDVVELLIANIEPVERAEVADRLASRVRRAADALRAEVESVGELLARSRRQAKLTPEQLEQESGVAAELLRQIEEDRAVARLLNLPPKNVAALTNRLNIPPQLFVASLARSIPPPSSFVYAYRPRQFLETPAEYAAEEQASRLIDWLEEYLRA